MTVGELVRRVVVPVGDDETGLVMAASVLASWFGATVQFVTDNPARRPHLETLSRGLGVDAEEVVVLDADRFGDEFVLHLADVERAVVVATNDDRSRAMATRSAAPTFLVPRRTSQRLETGPLVVGIDTGEARFDRLALAITWGRELDLGVRLVVDDADPLEGVVAESLQRVASMGVEVGADRLRTHGQRSDLLVARTRAATALVVNASELDDTAFVEHARREGVPLLVVPEGQDHSVLRGEALEGGETAPGRGVLGATSLSEAITRLAGCRHGRLGYVDHGWPIVVPVNFVLLTGDRAESVLGAGDVIIRSLDGGKFEAARRHDVVCLEVDELDPATRTGWSVVVHGRLELITDAEVLRAAWDLHDEVWVDGERGHWLRLVPFTVTGREVTSSSGRSE